MIYQLYECVIQKTARSLQRGEGSGAERSRPVFERNYPYKTLQAGRVRSETAKSQQPEANSFPPTFFSNPDSTLYV